jgi:hypothetical protein
MGEIRMPARRDIRQSLPRAEPVPVAAPQGPAAPLGRRRRGRREYMRKYMRKVYRPRVRQRKAAAVNASGGQSRA